MISFAINSWLSMSNKIIVNDSVVYDKMHHCIYTQNNPSEKITLPIPASLCLQVLIEKPGEIIPYQYFLEKVWRERGMVVASNTLSQNIAHLRKAFANAGLDEQVIKTLHKRGVIFVGDIGVTDEVDSELFNTTADTLAEECATINQGGVYDDVSTTPEKKGRDARQEYGGVILSGASIVSVIAFLLCYNFMQEKGIPVHRPEAMRDISLDKKCNIYRNITFKTDEYYHDFIRKNNAGCDHNKKWVYIVNFPPSEHFSVMRCVSPLYSKKYKELPLCISEYYEGGHQ